MQWKNAFAEALRRCVANAQVQNGYSLRAFAKSLGVPVSTLSECIREKDSVTARRAGEIVKKLPIEKEEQDRLLALMHLPPQQDRAKLPEEDYKILLDWRYIAILTCFELDGQDHEAVAIAKRLGIDVKEAAAILDDLVARGFLRAQGGGLVKSEDHWQTSDGPPRDVIRRHHLENLEVARRALENVPADQRDFTSFTFAGNLQDLALIRQEIRALHARISAIVEGSRPKNRLLRFTINFFPMDQQPEESGP